MTNRKTWRQVVCPTCNGKELSFRETRDVSVHFRQGQGQAPVREGHRVVYQNQDGYLHEFDLRTAYPQDLQAKCHNCGLNWHLKGCQRIEDLSSTAKSREVPKGPTRRISASAVVKDIVARMTDTELMSKYDLNARELEVLLQRLVETGLVTQMQIDDRLSLADTAITKAFDETRRSIDELDFGDTQPQPRQSAPAPAPKEKSPKKKTASVATINVNSFMTDALSGVPDGELMTTYSLNPKQLQYVFQRLVDSSYITLEELIDRARITNAVVTKAFVKVYRTMRDLDG